MLRLLGGTLALGLAGWWFLFLDDRDALLLLLGGALAWLPENLYD